MKEFNLKTMKAMQNSLTQASKAKARGYKTFKNLSAIVYLVTGKLDFSKTGLAHLK